MATTSDYLKQLQADKQVLVDNLVAKGVTATSNETFTTLVPKVNDIQSGGGDISEYFTETISSGSSSTIGGHVKTIKKLPALKNTGSSCKYMFAGFTGTEIDLSNFDTSQVVNMSRMFNQTSKLTSLDLSNFITSRVTDMSYMFSGNSALENLDLSNFDTSQVVNMRDMFAMVKKISSLDLSNFITSRVTDMSNIFSECIALKNLDIRNFDFTNVTSYSYMFNSVPTDCLIIVKDDTAKEWITSKFTTLTNVKTVAELES